MFNVPDSNLSGKKSGWVNECDKLPVPPRIKGLHILFNSSSIINPPIPWGPNKLLWPVKAKALNDKSLKFISSTPALWALSNIKNMPSFLHKSPISLIGWIEPTTFDAWVITINLVFDLIKFFISFTSTIPILFASTISKSIFNVFFKLYRGLITELCSIEEVIIWSPDFITPFNKMFSDEVMLFVNITFSGLS